MRRLSKKVAVCGVICSLGVVVILLGGLFPFLEFTVPAIAGVLLILLITEYGYKWALFSYVIISLLSLIVAAFRMESVLLFIAFFGYYPILKSKLETLKSRVLQMIFKYICFNFAVISFYALTYYIFKLSFIIEQFKDISKIMLPVLLIMANVTFLFYDIVISRLTYIYVQRVRKNIYKII